MNEVDSCNLPSVRQGRKSKRKITTGIKSAASGSRYKDKGVLKALSATKRPPSK